MLNLNANDRLEEQPVFIREIAKKVGQNNKEYYHLEISSGVKKYDARIWQNNLSLARGITPGSIAYIWGTAKDFKGSIQVHIENIQLITNPARELIEKLIPSSNLEEKKLVQDIESIIETIKNPDIKLLLNNIFASKEIRSSFYRRAAGIEIHHAYLGGLAEHTLEVARIVINLCGAFRYISYDIAVASALLHDIGKTIELSDFPENKYTTEGRLLGHISIGAKILNCFASEMKGFPHDLLLELQHCILSHHGLQEAGSPIVPMTVEAVALHNADRTSAELNGFNLAIERDCNTTGWTDYNSIYRRYIKKYE
jgi:3'-5' exoribonuclease